MGIGITVIFNEDGTFELGENTPRTRNKGKSIIDLPSDFTVIDIETTGLDSSYDEIIEIGALKVRNNEIVDMFESLIKPKGYYFYVDGKKCFNYVSEFITELTGITNDMLHTAPIIKDVLPNFLNFIKDDVLIGHNVNFDINFLYDNLLYELDYTFSNNFIDLMRLTRKIYPEFENHKLSTIAKNLNVCNDAYHRALMDCRITFDCYKILKNTVKEKNIDIQNLFKKKKKSNSTKLDKLEPTSYEFKEDHIFYNKYCTFTGKLEKIDRKSAAQIVVNIGGHCLNSVTKKTNFLILGNLDYCSNIKGGKSSKLKKAEKLILDGYDLQIISENVFYDLISEP